MWPPLFERGMVKLSSKAVSCPEIKSKHHTLPMSGSMRFIEQMCYGKCSALLRDL